MKPGLEIDVSRGQLLIHVHHCNRNTCQLFRRRLVIFSDRL